MKKEDKEFLKELQSELIKQDPDGQANPRFWSVCERREIPSLDDCDTPKIHDLCEGNVYDLEEYVELITDYINETESDYKAEWDYIDKDDVDAVVDLGQKIFNTDLEVFYVESESQIVENTFFLTKRAAAEHIKQNGYHYSDPHTYGQTAWRSPEFERFLKIFTEMNLDDIKED